MSESVNPNTQLIKGIKGLLASLRYQELILEANPKDLKAFDRWAFLPGMLFRARDKWWGKGKRALPHEGLDLCLFREKGGRLLRLPASSGIPAPCDGVILGTALDFLGESIFFTQSDTSGIPILWASGHMKLESQLVRQRVIQKGQILGSISQHRSKNPGMLPHLHISIAIPLHRVLLEEPSWKNLAKPQLAKLVNPLCMFKDAMMVNPLYYSSALSL